MVAQIINTAVERLAEEIVSTRTLKLTPLQDTTNINRATRIHPMINKKFIMPKKISDKKPKTNINKHGRR